MPKNYNLFLKGSVGYWNFNADMVSFVLDKHKNSRVDVLIDSLGGDTATALSISSLFRLHGDVHCHYVGMNASAATIASMGAKHISIDADALFLVHKCMAPVFEWDYMNADELDAHIEELKKTKKDNETIDGCIAGMYAKRCKKTKEELLDLMKEGAWLTAGQALEWGFVDEITNEAEDPAPVLTDSVASVIADAGIPMPPIDVKKGSFLERLFKAFSPSFQSADEAKKPEAAKSTVQMPKKFTAVGALLGTAVSVSDGKLTITEQQADTLEAAVAAHDTTVNDLNSKIAEKDNKIAELNAKIADLVKEPADDTKTINQTPGEVTQDSIDIDKMCDAILSNF
ncbi:MAG: ATP-dependent Clp protease proteolytic subunit [Muribaculaceae bacterium]|nr:ATP-dependent Clp protease proteolytic subunit [Muribaculaceae bacterium]